MALGAIGSQEKRVRTGPSRAVTRQLNRAVAIQLNRAVTIQLNRAACYHKVPKH